MPTHWLLSAEMICSQLLIDSSEHSDTLAPRFISSSSSEVMSETTRPLIRDLTNLLHPLLETEADRKEWLDLAFADFTELRGDIDWSGSARRLVSGLLTRQGAKGRQGLLNLLDDIADHKGADWQRNIQSLRAQVAAFAPGAEPIPRPRLPLCHRLKQPGRHR